MRALERRLRKLEGGRRLDPSGLRPHSEGWLHYWDHQFHRFCSGDHGVVLTLAGVRAAMQRGVTPEECGKECQIRWTTAAGRLDASGDLELRTMDPEL